MPEVVVLNYSYPGRQGKSDEQVQVEASQLAAMMTQASGQKWTIKEFRTVQGKPMKVGGNMDYGRLVDDQGLHDGGVVWAFGDEQMGGLEGVVLGPLGGATAEQQVEATRRAGLPPTYQPNVRYGNGHAQVSPTASPITKPVAIYTFNTTRGLGEDLHSMGHAVEASAKNYDPARWQAYTGRVGGVDAGEDPLNMQLSPVEGGYGTIHRPPGATQAYQYGTPEEVPGAPGGAPGPNGSIMGPTGPGGSDRWGGNQEGYLRWWLGNMPTEWWNYATGDYEDRKAVSLERPVTGLTLPVAQPPTQVRAAAGINRQPYQTPGFSDSNPSLTQALPSAGGGGNTLPSFGQMNLSLPELLRGQATDQGTATGPVMPVAPSTPVASTAQQPMVTPQENLTPADKITPQTDQTPQNQITPNEGPILPRIAEISPERIRELLAENEDFEDLYPDQVKKLRQALENPQIEDDFVHGLTSIQPMLGTPPGRGDVAGAYDRRGDILGPKSALKRDIYIANAGEPELPFAITVAHEVAHHITDEANFLLQPERWNKAASADASGRAKNDKRAALREAILAYDAANGRHEKTSAQYAVPGDTPATTINGTTHWKEDVADSYAFLINPDEKVRRAFVDAYPEKAKLLRAGLAGMRIKAAGGDRFTYSPQGDMTVQYSQVGNAQTGAPGVGVGGGGGVTYTREQIMQLIRDGAIARGINPALALAIVDQESVFNPNAEGDYDPRLGRKKSIGLFQLNEEGMGKGMTVEQRQDPVTNINVGLDALAAEQRRRPNVLPGILAAASQRPENTAEYAASVQRKFTQYSSSGGNSSPATASTSQLVWPVAGRAWGSGITDPFGGPQANAGTSVQLASSNHGMDIGAAFGDQIVAPITGRVVEVYDARSDSNKDENHAWGGSIVIQDAQGRFHRLSHQQTGTLAGFKVGQQVTAGQPLGRVGTSGNSTGPHVDYEAYTGSGPMSTDRVFMNAVDLPKITSLTPGNTQGSDGGSPRMPSIRMPGIAGAIPAMTWTPEGMIAGANSGFGNTPINVPAPTILNTGRGTMTNSGYARPGPSTGSLPAVTGPDAATLQAYFNAMLTISQQSISSLGLSGQAPQMTWDPKAMSDGAGGWIGGFVPTGKAVDTLAAIAQRYTVNRGQIDALVRAAGESGHVPMLDMTEDGYLHQVFDSRGAPQYLESVASRTQRQGAGTAVGFVDNALQRQQSQARPMNAQSGPVPGQPAAPAAAAQENVGPVTNDAGQSGSPPTAPTGQYGDPFFPGAGNFTDALGNEHPSGPAGGSVFPMNRPSGPDPSLVASDGRSIANEPSEVQTQFTAVYGDQAAAEWKRQHEAALGLSTPSTTPPSQPQVASAPSTGQNVDNGPVNTPMSAMPGMGTEAQGSVPLHEQWLQQGQ